MKYLSEEINNKIITAVEEKFEPVIVDNINRFIDFFNTVTELREAFPDYDEKQMILNTENAKKICDNINIQIDKHYQRNENITFENLFPGLSDQLGDLILQLEPSIEVEQSEVRFSQLADDKNTILVAKRIKAIVFKSQQLILKLINPVLTKVKRQPFKLKYWNQKIPLRNVGLYFLRNKLLTDLSSVYNDIFKALSKKSITFWEYDENYDEEYILNFIKSDRSESDIKLIGNPEIIIEELESLKEELKKHTLASIEQCFQEFYSNCEKAGTIELSKSRFNNKRISKHFNSVINEFNRTIKEWDNTFYALGEDWELNCDLESTRYSAIEVFYQFVKSLSIKNKIKIYPQFKEIAGSLNFINEKLNQSASDVQDLERLIAYSKETLEKILLSSVLPNLISAISDLRLQGMINEARRAIKNQIRSLVEKRSFVKTTDYDKRIKSSEIDEIYPREFISFNTLPKFLASLEKIKADSSVELKNIQSELINLGNMADFGLESAIAAAVTENISKSEVKEIGLEGIKISRDKQEQLLDSFNKVCNEVIENLRSSIAKYCEEMYSFTQSSKINEIRLQLVKAKGRAKAKEVKDKFFSLVSNFIPIIFGKIKNYYKKGFRLYSNTRKQFGLTESGVSITSEISNFLSRANSSVEKLPYIYRRLFQISPLENDRLYISRELEESQLQMAYANWLNGGYAPVIISAEKGGGITSFLNIVLNTMASKNTIKRLSIKPSVCNQQDLLKILGEIFLPEKFLGIEELVNYLKNEENRQIVVIENLQHIYLRSVNGFNCVKTLTDIISKTSKTIFWITSSTLYANEFLNKTVRLNDVFGYNILLKQLQSDQIIALIKKRNSISGYNLEYEHDAAVTGKKDLEKLTYEQKQTLLEKEFFDSLNKFAQSNVSLALLFWLRSIKEIQERKVYINSDLEISNTLLNSLVPERVFVLQSLVLHDGLRVSDLAKTLNFSMAETNQLTQILYDDGILVKNGEVFLINPLLYRQSVTLLKSKNLL
jgi:hypothetical protein